MQIVKDSMSARKKPIIGTIFSSDSSDDEPPRYSKTSASESEKPIRLKVNTTGHVSDSSVKSPPKPIQEPPIKKDSTAPNGFVEFDKKRIGALKPNTIIGYKKENGKIILSKYYKSFDPIGNVITVGFNKHARRNYTEPLSKILAIYVLSTAIEGGADPLKETIEIPKDEWKSLRRDMILSYEKADHEFIYRVKFNSFIKNSEGASKMSFTTETGYNYMASPSNIIKIYRHLTGNDKTLSFILEVIKKLDTRIRRIEERLKK